MKNIILILALTFLTISCIENESDNQIETTKTTVKGNVSDIERDIDIENFRIVLARFYYCGTTDFFNSDCSEIIDTVFTDTDGFYSLKFDFILGERYGFIKQYYGNPYYTESIGNTNIEEGKINIRNINAWYPIILKLELRVTNNDNPFLRISNKVIDNSSLHFATADIFERDIDTVVYIRTKPNSDIELNFHYSTGNSNNDYHQFLENLTTTLQDTISFSYNIDCATF